jgi:hypothetical protein
MSNITSTSELRKAIVMLENEQEARGQLLRQQFRFTYESLKLVNLLKSAVHEMASTPSLTADFIRTAAGLAFGQITRKVVAGSSGGILRGLIGSVIQFGISNLVVRFPTGIKWIRQLAGRRKVNEG